MTRRQLNASVGVLILDAQLRLVHYTAEAATILEYPRKRRAVPLDRVLQGIRSQIAIPAEAGPPRSFEFMSGRRRYRCKAFVLDPNNHNAGGHHGRPAAGLVQPTIVAILERMFPEAADIRRWCETFQLTTRESETVKLLLKGMTSKEIADQMNISPSTVKSFLKLVMNKVGASNRMGIIAKILAIGSGSSC